VRHNVVAQVLHGFGLEDGVGARLAEAGTQRSTVLIAPSEDCRGHDQARKEGDIQEVGDHAVR